MVLSDQMPVLVLPETTLFPASFLPAIITAPAQIKLMHDVINGNRFLIVAMRKLHAKGQTPEPVACLGIPRIAVTAHDGSIRAVFQGLARVELEERLITKPYPIYTYQVLESPPFDTETVRELLDEVCNLVEENLVKGKLVPFASQVSTYAIPKVVPADATQSLITFLRSVDDPQQVTDFISSTLLRRAKHRQTLLETLNLESRLKLLLKFLNTELRNSKKRKNRPNELF